MANRLFAVVEPSFIADQLAPAGSRVYEAALNGATPGSNLVEINPDGTPVRQEDLPRLLRLGLPPGPVTIAPVMPHAPNPVHPQSLPGQTGGGVQLAGNAFAGLVAPAEGVESYEAAQARVEQLAAALEDARALAATLDEARAAGVEEGPVAPRRTGEGAPVDPVLDGNLTDVASNLDKVSDVRELERLRGIEEGGANRKGALEAIDARIAELS